ncbi:sugar kinase [Photobacterium profundum]|uniref:2-dehydro-3-deoxygluconokinase n=1 Tax=Photobacterium profundum (strain SS9) TaxID=298386 RepID=Q6LGI7_PHOPR|nr:sugar kinase [Photobacterium profundum]CAG23593.1 putative 2-dehydro-3-deoxygluconokinase [Photobacterium profundum SS9]
MTPITRVAIIGECMVELKKNDGSIEQSFGGDTLNTAVYLSRLTQQHGISTSYVTGLGRDPFSKEMLAAWREEGINTDMVYLSDDKLPGMYAIETTEDGERSFYYWRNDSAAKYWLRERAILTLAKELCQHQMVYLSGISLAILSEDCRQSLINLLALCCKDGLKIAFDNNYRPTLWESAEQAQTFYKQILAITDIAFLTFDDEQMLYGDDNEQQTIERTQALGVQEIVIKRGGDDCYVVTPGSLECVAPHPVGNIIDTTAAGDSFSAGYLAKRITGGTPHASALAGHLLAGNVIQHRGAIISRDDMPNI